MTTGLLVPVPVPGAGLPLQTDGKRLAALRPIVEFFGLDHSGQLQKLRGKSWAVVEKFSTTGSDGKTYEMIGVDRRTLGMWLATLDEHRVHAERRDDLRAYQSEAADALDAYFHGEAATALDLSDPIGAIEHANARSQQAIEIAKAERVARVEAEQHAKALAAPAAAWSHMADSAGDYEVADAAKVLSRDPNIQIGRGRLFSFMAAEGWIYRNASTSRWKAYQTQVDRGRLVEKLGKPFLHEPTGQMRLSDPTIRITPKGLAELHRRLGGSAELALVAAS